MTGATLRREGVPAEAKEYTMSRDQDAKVVYTAGPSYDCDLSPCEVCGAEDYGTLCWPCMEVTIERCPHCDADHAIVGQIECFADLQEATLKPPTDRNSNETKERERD
jgi:hypothetical protein